jgi:hypothetical protein
MNALRFCDTCEVSHAENCPKCFGFGVYRLKGSDVPVSASVAHGDDPPLATVETCQVCGGGVNNKGAAKST